MILSIVVVLTSASRQDRGDGKLSHQCKCMPRWFHLHGAWQSMFAGSRSKQANRGRSSSAQPSHLVNTARTLLPDCMQRCRCTFPLPSFFAPPACHRKRGHSSLPVQPSIARPGSRCKPSTRASSATPKTRPSTHLTLRVTTRAVGFGATAGLAASSSKHHAPVP